MNQTERLTTLLENLNPSLYEQQTEELLSKIKYFHQKKLWNEFSISLTSLIYSNSSYNCENLILRTISQLNMNLDIYLIFELLDFYLSKKKNLNLEQKMEMIKNCQTFTKEKTPNLYLSIIESKHRLLEKDLENGFLIFNKVETEIEKIREFPKIIFSALNFTKAIYFWEKQDFKMYYDSIMTFLAYFEKSKLSGEENLEICERTILSALVCESILNFGEIMKMEILGFIKDFEEKKVLWEMIAIFNKGDVTEFLNFYEKNKNKIESIPLLKSKIAQLDRKIRVISLYDCIFFSENSFNKQFISFQEICNITKISKFEVEKLLIHVLSIELIKGYIDEAEEMFYIKSLKPRNLDVKRLEQLREKFGNWMEGILESREFVKSC